MRRTPQNDGTVSSANYQRWVPFPGLLSNSLLIHVPAIRPPGTARDHGSHAGHGAKDGHELPRGDGCARDHGKEDLNTPPMDATRGTPGEGVGAGYAGVSAQREPGAPAGTGLRPERDESLRALGPGIPLPHAGKGAGEPEGGLHRRSLGRLGGAPEDRPRGFGTDAVGVPPSLDGHRLEVGPGTGGP